MMCEQLKGLCAEDFMAPNQVLCYGGGEVFQRIMPSMIDRGINVAAVIDATKRGTVAAGGRELPCISIAEACETYQADTIIVVTIANEEVFLQVKDQLREQGFSEDRIFDLNVWSWLTVPSEKSYCSIMSGSCLFFAPAQAICCKTGIDEPFYCEWFVHGRPVKESIDHYFEKRLYYMEEAKKGRIPLYCKGCNSLSSNSEEMKDTITIFGVDDHAFCNADCIYCEYACSLPKRKTGAAARERYAAILYTLETIQRRNMLDQQAFIQLAGGEITVNPYKKEIYEAVKHAIKQLPQLQVQILSNCFIYDQEIADILLLGRSSFLQCDLDAGTPETYIKVKGFNKFDVVRENLKRYVRFGAVKLKYIVLPGWNDTQADYDGTAALLKELNIKELTLSLDFKVSRNGSREQVQKVLYATARFLSVLEQNGIQGIMPTNLWKEKNAAIVQRLYHELLTCTTDNRGDQR